MFLHKKSSKSLVIACIDTHLTFLLDALFLNDLQRVKRHTKLYTGFWYFHICYST